MKKLMGSLFAIMLGLSVSFSSYALDEINITDTTCEEAGEMNEDELIVLLIWMDGYLSAKEGVVMFDLEVVQALGESMSEYCEENPDDSLLRALKESE